MPDFRSKARANEGSNDDDKTEYRRQTTEHWERFENIERDRSPEVHNSSGGCANGGNAVRIVSERGMGSVVCLENSKGE